MDNKTEEQIVGIKHTLNQTLGESIHLADSQRELNGLGQVLGQACGGLTGEYFFEGLPVPEQQPLVHHDPLISGSSR